jgi:hypothetical protein
MLSWLHAFYKYLNLHELVKEILEREFELGSKVAISGLQSQPHGRAVVSPGIFPTL